MRSFGARKRTKLAHPLRAKVRRVFMGGLAPPCGTPALVACAGGGVRPAADAGTKNREAPNAVPTAVHLAKLLNRALSTSKLLLEAAWEH